MFQHLTHPNNTQPNPKKYQENSTNLFFLLPNLRETTKHPIPTRRGARPIGPMEPPIACIADMAEIAEAIEPAATTGWFKDGLMCLIPSGNLLHSY